MKTLILAAIAACALASQAHAKAPTSYPLIQYVDNEDTADDLDSKAGDLEDEAQRLRDLDAPDSLDLDRKAGDMEDRAQEMRDEADRLRDLN